MDKILISSNKSGGGKTTFTLCFMKALMNRGLNVQGYKCGPDYIDTRFHSEVTKIDSRNIDSVLMNDLDIKNAFNSSLGDINVIEGVMGFYDGVGANTNGSSYEISEKYDVPVILVISPKAQSMTLASEIKGILEFRKNNIIGIVLSKVTKKYYDLLKTCIEENTNTKVLGYFESLDFLQFPSRHLGLVQSSEIDDILERIEKGAHSLESTLDIDYILDAINFSKAECNKKKNINKSEVNLKKLDKPNLAIAFDKAFSFYYKDNLDLLQKDFNVIKFSPLVDSRLPKDIDFLYLGGGYPEVFKKDLSNNKSLLLDIKEKLTKGLPCYAECGGLMYLTQSIEGEKTVGFFEGDSMMTKSLQNFGYCMVTSNKGKISNGCVYKAHEFHKSKIENHEENITDVYKISDPNKKWNCGYEKENTFAQYAHIHFSSSMSLYENLRKLALNHFLDRNLNK